MIRLRKTQEFRKRKKTKSKVLEYIVVAVFMIVSNSAFEKIADANGFGTIWQYHPTTTVSVYNQTTSSFFNEAVYPNTIEYTRDLDGDHVMDIVMGSKLPKHDHPVTITQPLAELTIISGATGQPICTRVQPSGIRYRNVSFHKDENNDGKGDILAIVDRGANSGSLLQVISSVDCSVIQTRLLATGVYLDGGVNTLLKRFDLDNDNSPDIVTIDAYFVQAISN